MKSKKILFAPFTADGHFNPLNLFGAAEKELAAHRFRQVVEGLTTGVMTV